MTELLVVHQIRFEVVGNTFMHKYCNADPMYYKHTTQLIPNELIPDEEWSEVVTPTFTNERWDQYNNLRKDEKRGYGFIRNVRLFRAVVQEPAWEEVPKT